MDSNLFKSIVVVSRANNRGLVAEVGRMLKQRYGSSIHLLCPLPDEVPFYQKNYSGVFDSIAVCPRLLRSNYPANLSTNEVFARARDLEKRYRTTINTLALQNRHFGRGFAPGGYYQPRSRQSESVDYVQMVDTYNQVLAFWEGVLTSKDATLVINASNEAMVVAEGMGIPIRNLMTARFENKWLWVIDSFDSTPGVEARFHQTDASAEIEKADVVPYRASFLNRERVLQRQKLWHTLAQVLRLCKNHLIWRLTGYYKGKEYYLSSHIYFRYKIWKDLNYLIRKISIPLSSLRGKTFIYFPLHVEPERALQGLSPEYMYQHAAIVSLSRDLPAGILLGVKEHLVAAGQRPADFYSQIRDLKNVVLLDPRELGIDVINQAAAVATISGTAGMEAAGLGIPVIAFGRHNPYNFLPHVTEITREEDLRDHLERILTIGIDRDQSERDGARFYQALRDYAFDLGDYIAYESTDIEPWMAESALTALERSFDFEEIHADGDQRRKTA